MKLAAFLALLLAATDASAMAATSEPRTMRDAILYCEQNPDARENGVDENLISIHACAVRILGVKPNVKATAMESALSNRPGIMLAARAYLENLSCRDIAGAGWDHMPSMSDYVKTQPGAGKLGYESPCHIDSLVFAQCWLEPRWSVLKAVDALLRKAANGKKLPDIPACGA